MKRATPFVVLALAITSCTGSSPTATATHDPAQVSRADLGEQWPLTVDSGTLHCVPGDGNTDQVTFTAADGNSYAVNGWARTLSGLPDIDAIWADDPTIAGAKISIGPLIDRGLALCTS